MLSSSTLLLTNRICRPTLLAPKCCVVHVGTACQSGVGMEGVGVQRSQRELVKYGKKVPAPVKELDPALGRV